MAFGEKRLIFFHLGGGAQTRFDKALKSVIIIK